MAQKGKRLMEHSVVIVCAAPEKVARAKRKPWMVPGAMPVIAAMVRAAGWDVWGWDETAKGPIQLDTLKEGVTLVLLTGLTPSYNRMNEIADYCRQNNIPLVAGGRDVIGWSREEGGLNLLSKRFPSFCTTHMTHELMALILSDCANGNLLQHYFVPPRTPYEFVVPDRNVIDPFDYYASNCVRSSVGCLRNCPWCTVGGQGQFFKPAEILEAELKTFQEGWFFLDTSDSFASNLDFVRDVIIPIYRASGMRWGVEATVSDLLSDDGRLIDEMRRARCVFVYIGIESIVRDVSSKTSRERAEEVIRRCRRAGIIVVGSLMLDVSGDETLEEIKKTIAWANRWLDFAQFSLVALLPGCALRVKAIEECSIIESDWSRFDGAHPTMKHKLSPAERSVLLNKAYQEFSRMPWILRRTLRLMRTPRVAVAVLLGGLRYREGIPQL